MTRAERIEEAARALLDGSEGIKLNAGTAEVMNYWNRYRGLRADLRAALSLPPEPEGRPDAPDHLCGECEAPVCDHVVAANEQLVARIKAAPDEYRRGVEDAAKWLVATDFFEEGDSEVLIAALAPPPAPAADLTTAQRWTAHIEEIKDKLRPYADPYTDDIIDGVIETIRKLRVTVQDMADENPPPAPAAETEAEAKERRKAARRRINPPARIIEDEKDPPAPAAPATKEEP